MTPQEAVKNYHWIKLDESNRIIELYMDHQMLSTLRTCEAKFQLEHLANLRPYGIKSWSLQYGAFIHKCLEYFYYSMQTSSSGDPIPISDFLVYAKDQWKRYRLDDYKDIEPKYKKIGGLDGALALLAHYHAYYHDLRVRVVDTEVTFGFNREVYLGEFNVDLGGYPIDEWSVAYHPWTVKCYLTGRIDLIVDNGFKIGPVDHKHSAYFSGDEAGKFNPHDGITGYIFALQTILRDKFPSYFNNGRDCRSGWIYHIAATQPKSGDRFKATPIYKTQEQIEEFKQRQLATFKRITDILFNDAEPQWSTDRCSNIYNRSCEYKRIHEVTPSERPNIISGFYQIAPAWNPALVDEEQYLIRDKVMEATQSEAEEVTE